MKSMSRVLKEDRRSFGRATTGLLRGLMTSVALLALATGSLEAQTASPDQAAVLGTGVQAPLRFAGESGPENQVTLSFGASAFYDDNVFANNVGRVSDEGVSLSSHFGAARQTEHLRLTFDYMPFFMLYRQSDQYDRLNHTANVNLSYQLSPRFVLGLHDAFSYQNGLFPSLSGQQIMSGPASPTGLDQLIYPYTTRTLSNAAGLDVTFEKSRRTSVTLSGGFGQRKFGSQTTTQPLYNDVELSGGLQYQYRLTPHTSFGILLLHQDTTYQGGQVFGNRLRSQVENVFLSLGSRVSPSVTITVYGGTEYFRTIGESAVLVRTSGRFQGAGGASITKQVGKTAVDLSGQRLVSDGGGLYTSVIKTSASVGLRRRLVGRWEGSWYGGAIRADSSLFQLASGKTDGVMSGVSLSRPVARGSVFRVSYDTVHQLSKGTLPISATFDRNQVSVGFDYRLKAIDLGR